MFCEAPAHGAALAMLLTAHPIAATAAELLPRIKQVLMQRFTLCVKAELLRNGREREVLGHCAATGPIS